MVLRKTIAVLITVWVVACAGCESHAENKKAAKQRVGSTSAQIKVKLAQQHYDSGKTKEALKLVTESISAEPQLPEAHLLLGKILLAEGKRQEAIGELRTAIDLDEKLDEGWYWLGLAFEVRGQNQPDWQIQQRLSYYNKAMKLCPTKVDYILAVSETYAAQNKLEEAVRLLEEKLEIMPDEVSLMVAAAELLGRLGHNEQAIELYREAMVMSGGEPAITESLGCCYMFSGRWKEAAELFSRLFEGCEDSRRKKFYLEVMALCNMNSGQYGKAVEYYSELTIEQRDNAKVWVQMGQAALGGGAVQRALACGRKALALQPGLPDAIALVGCAQYACGEYTLAVKSFEKIAADDRNAGFAQLMIARCHERLGQKDRAEREYKEVLETNPGSELADFLAKAKNRTLEAKISVSEDTENQL